MRAAVIYDYLPGIDHVQVSQRAASPPADQDVVVEVHAAPIHPSDLAFIAGRYGIRKQLPAVPGFEGMGIVTAAGLGVSPDWVGRRVCVLAGGADGTWSQAMTTSVSSIFPAPEQATDDAASMLLVNPLTAWALVDLAQSVQASTIIQTAAASALGKMILRRCMQVGIDVINVVRREAQIDELKQAGAQYILNSSEPTFEKHLRELTRSLETTIAFDAVGGQMTASLLRAVRNGGSVVVYGGLAGEPAMAGVDQLVFRDKQVRGFWLSHWLTRTPVEKRMEAWNAVQAHHADYESRVAGRYPLDAIHDALVDYSADMTRGKVLIVPQS